MSGAARAASGGRIARTARTARTGTGRTAASVPPPRTAHRRTGDPPGEAAIGTSTSTSTRQARGPLSSSPSPLAPIPRHTCRTRPSRPRASAALTGRSRPANPALKHRHHKPQPNLDPDPTPGTSIPAAPAPLTAPAPLSTPSLPGYSPTVPFDRTLRIPLQTPRMTLKQTAVVVGIAMVGSTLAGLGASARPGLGATARRGPARRATTRRDPR